MLPCGLGLHTAADVHYGQAPAVRAARAQFLDAACQAHLERFVSKPPAPPKLPGTSWINPPRKRNQPLSKKTLSGAPDRLTDSEVAADAGPARKCIEALLGAGPIHRDGEPEDIAGAVAWLLSDEAGYVTGQVIGVNGGRYI